MIIELIASFKLYHSLQLRIYIWKITSNYFYNVEDFEEKKVARIALGGDNLRQIQSADIPKTLYKNYHVHPECY